VTRLAISWHSGCQAQLFNLTRDSVVSGDGRLSNQRPVCTLLRIHYRLVLVQATSRLTMFSPRMVENFFKRTRFRRSRRLRSSFRTSLIKKSPTAAGSTAASPAAAVKRVSVARSSNVTKDASADASAVGE